MRPRSLSMLFGVNLEHFSGAVTALQGGACAAIGSLTFSLPIGAKREGAGRWLGREPDPSLHWVSSHTVLAVLVGLASLSGLPGCKKEGKQLGKALKQTIDYSTQFDEKTKFRFQHGKLPKEVWRAQENTDDPNRPKFDMDFWVDRNSPAQVIRKRLQALVTTVKQGSPYRAVRARAWVKGLVHFGDAVGEYWLASDGGGWDGSPIGYRHLEVHAVTDLRRQPYRVALEAEKAWVELMQRRRMKRLARKDPLAVDRKAFEKAAERLGLTPESVADTIAKVRGLFVSARARAQPATSGRRAAGRPGH